MAQSDNTKILLKNLGINESFFEANDNSIYVIKKDKLRKNYSEGAVTKLSSTILTSKRCREEEDLDIYNEADNEYNLFKPEQEEPGLVDNYIQEYSECEDADEEEHEENVRVQSEDNNLTIFQNCAKNQMTQLNEIFYQMNNKEEAKVIIKAYKSKLKSKFYEIYEHNSKVFNERIKHKIFHKCNFPGCNRTFASSGWLKSHFNEHLKEIKKNKFNILFDSFILQCRNMTIR